MSRNFELEIVWVYIKSKHDLFWWHKIGIAGKPNLSKRKFIEKKVTLIMLFSKEISQKSSI